jgi:hypothetical protein
MASQNRKQAAMSSNLMNAPNRKGGVPVLCKMKSLLKIEVAPTISDFELLKKLGRGAYG